MQSNARLVPPGGRWENVREAIFSVFYIMLERYDRGARHSRFARLRCWIMLLVDAGQVLRAIVLDTFGWSTRITGVMYKVDCLDLWHLSVHNLVQVINIIYFCVTGGYCWLDSGAGTWQHLTFFSLCSQPVCVS